MTEQPVYARNRCCRLLCREFHYSKFCFFYRDWRAFTYTPWLPYKWYFQLPYLIYRWVIAIFFFTWLMITAIETDDPRFLIYLTEWSFIAFNLHLIWSAIATTYQFFKVHLFCTEKYQDSDFRGSADFVTELPNGCGAGQRRRNGGIVWYQMIQWILFTIGTDMALGVSILFWSLLYNSSIKLDGGNVTAHLVNGIIALVEIWVTGVPVHFLHFVYVQIFAASYGVWTGIYFAANLTNNIDEERYIYSVLDYEANPGTAAALVILTVLVLAPAIHLVFYVQYVLRYWLVYIIYGRRVYERIEM